MIEFDDAVDDHTSHPNLEVTVNAEPDGLIWVRSVIAFLGIARMRISFQEKAELPAVFRPEVASEFTALCRDMAPEDGVLSLPDLRLSLSGLLIRGCVILARRAADGSRQIIIRIRRFAGNALALFKAEVIPADGLSLRYEQLSSMAVEKFFLPIANLNHLLDEVLGSTDAAAQRRVLQSLERLRAHTLALQASFAALVTEIGGAALEQPQPQRLARIAEQPG